MTDSTRRRRPRRIRAGSVLARLSGSRWLEPVQAAALAGIAAAVLAPPMPADALAGLLAAGPVRTGLPDTPYRPARLLCYAWAAFA